MSEQTRGSEGHISTKFIDLAVELTFQTEEAAADFSEEKSWDSFQDVTANLPWCWDVAASPTCVRDNNKQLLIAVWKNRLLVEKDFLDYILLLLGKYSELQGIRIFYQHKESAHIELFDWHHTIPNKVAYWLCAIPSYGRSCYIMAQDTTELLHKMRCMEDLYGGSCYTMHKDLPLLRVHKAQQIVFALCCCKSCELLKGQLTCERHSRDIEDPKEFFCDDWKPRVADLDKIKEASHDN